ncbi:hypothetical protein K469DRAFT_712699 [Zopfia rhizophila CBS 207.26]|uniref:Uncharacterized protein n=1 Tax=Zopfia rhizophila CBS 207.26 TaxID=1314779 RepID=A0A6A6EQL1_9PEZI|nr:hypothetical protein K469DRAFT_712699 [Zopfia rhizophila CBS 207.26]
MLSRLPTALSLLIIATCADAAPGFIWNGPAPSPEDGPPASKNATRDKSLLPGQICGIVGGYVLTVLIWGVLLLTIGRRMRRKTENSPKTLELELVTARPSGKTPASPQSARSATSWFKKGFKKNPSINSSVASPTSPVVHSPNSFDQKVLDADRERAQVEMERLYAAVMDHDRKKSYSQISATEQETELEERPARINTSAKPDTTHSNPSSPRSPMKAIYPPGYYNGPPTAPLPRDRLRDQPPASPRSILSKKSHTSTGSGGSRARFNLKNLRISGPIQKYPGESLNDEARTPLSPRFYNPGAPPSPPTQQNSPTSPDEAYERLDEVQPLPRPAPQRAGSYTDSPTVSNAPKSASASSNSLPLRGYGSEPLKSPDLRTTVLDRKREQLSMTTPKTGVPYTPYSPYMPFTPVTPVTPHLMTKKERKSMKKINGRKIATREDMVQSPKEIFGDAY